MIELPDTDSVVRVADWVELSRALYRESISRPALSATLELTSGNEPSEAFISSVWRNLRLRREKYNLSYFRIDEYTIEIDADESYFAYQFCLFLSLYGMPAHTKIPARLFERLTKEAVEHYLSGQAIVFGWPFEARDGDDPGDEAAIGRKIRQLAERLGERFVEAPPARFKDRGVDVVGWIPFSEGRANQIVVLTQCAAGHDWKEKQPVPIDNWRQYIHWASNPITAYAIPDVISDNDWHEESMIKGILFDRIRLLNLLNGEVTDVDLRAEIRDWITAQIALHDT